MDVEPELSVSRNLDELSSLLRRFRTGEESTEVDYLDTLWKPLINLLRKALEVAEPAQSCASGIAGHFAERLLQELPPAGWLGVLCGSDATFDGINTTGAFSASSLEQLVHELEQTLDTRFSSDVTLVTQVLKLYLVERYAENGCWQQSLDVMDDVLAFRRHVFCRQNRPRSTNREQRWSSALSMLEPYPKSGEISHVHALWKVIADPYRVRIIRALLFLNLWEKLQERNDFSFPASVPRSESFTQLAESELAKGRHEEVSKLSTALSELVATGAPLSSPRCIGRYLGVQGLTLETWEDIGFLLAQSLCQGRIAEARAQYSRAALQYVAVVFGLDAFLLRLQETANGCRAHDGTGSQVWVAKPGPSAVTAIARAPAASRVLSSLASSEPEAGTLRGRNGAPFGARCHRITDAEAVEILFASVFRRAFCSCVLSPADALRHRLLRYLQQCAFRSATASRWVSHMRVERAYDAYLYRAPFALLDHLLAGRTIRWPLVRAGNPDDVLRSSQQVPQWLEDYCYVANEYLRPHQRGHHFYQAIAEHNLHALAQHCDALHIEDLRCLVSPPIPRIDACCGALSTKDAPANQDGEQRNIVEGIDVEQVLTRMLERKQFGAFAEKSVQLDQSLLGLAECTPTIDQVRGIVRFRETDKRRALAILGERSFLAYTAASIPVRQDSTTFAMDSPTNSETRSSRRRGQCLDSITEDGRSTDHALLLCCRELDAFRQFRARDEP